MGRSSLKLMFSLFQVACGSVVDIGGIKLEVITLYFKARFLKLKYVFSLPDFCFNQMTVNMYILEPFVFNFKLDHNLVAVCKRFGIFPLKP